MKPQPRYQPGDRIGGRYLVHKALMGGMGEVYLCLDLEEMYPYALKTFQQRYLTDTQRLRRIFEQEVATWVALEKHSNIVRCFYMTMLDSQPFMVLDWVASEENYGTDLRSWLRQGPLALNLALEIGIDICCGLMHAQAKLPGTVFVHRDLKPENILMAQGGLAKITDFGLAQIAEGARLEIATAPNENRQSFVIDKGIMGTPAYMAPEQWRGEMLDERTDIYALGCILYEMVTGASPFPSAFVSTTFPNFHTWLRGMQDAHEKGIVAPLSATFPTALNDLLQHCLAKAQADRLASLADMRMRLTDIYQAQFHQAPPIRPEPSAFTAVDYNNRGITYSALQQHAASLADFERAVALDPNYAKTYYNRGNTHRVLQQHTAALADFDRAIQLDPGYGIAYTGRGNTYADRQQHRAALADFDRAVKLDPNDANGYNNRGNTYAALQQYKAALVDFNRAIELDPKFSTAYANRGNLYHTLQQLEAALIDFGRSLELNPDNAIAYYNRGNLYLAQQQYVAALDDFSRATEIDPNYAIAYSNRGNTYQALQQHELALIDFSRAIEINPNLAQIYSNRGTSYYALQQFSAALSDYHRAIEIDPNYSPAYCNLGALLAGRGQLREALPYLEKAAQLGDPKGIRALAQVRQKLDLTLAPQRRNS